MADIIDLDELLGADKKVRLAGKTYALPADLPVELYLKINRFAQTDATDAEMVEALYEEILGLFAHRQPDLKALPLTMSQLVAAIGRIYGSDEANEEVAPRPPRTRGGAASSRKPGTRSR